LLLIHQLVFATVIPPETVSQYTVRVAIFQLAKKLQLVCRLLENQHSNYTNVVHLVLQNGKFAAILMYCAMLQTRYHFMYALRP
jgi:hypothetical protein